MIHKPPHTRCVPRYEILEDISDLKLKKNISDIMMGTSEVDTLSRFLQILTDLIQDHCGWMIVVLID